MKQALMQEIVSQLSALGLVAAASDKTDIAIDAELVDAAFSTATNVVYMKIKVADNAYRIYRTDANYDTRRVYMQASNIGRIAVFYDEDGTIVCGGIIGYSPQTIVVASE